MRKKERVKISTEELSNLFEEINLMYENLLQYLDEVNIETFLYKNKIYYVKKGKMKKEYSFESSVITSLKKRNSQTRLHLKKNKGLYNKIKTLDTILNQFNSLNIYESKNTKNKENFIENAHIETSAYEIFESYYICRKIYSSYYILLNGLYINYEYYINDISLYQKLYKKVLDINKKSFCNKTIHTNDLFDRNNKVYLKYKNIPLEENDLSLVNFDDKNISGLDISHHPEVQINFDKIIKDLTDSNINGYNLNKYTFRNFNLTNTDLRNTGATVDLSNCTISFEGKMNRGTLFDEDNTLMFGNKLLNEEEIRNLGIKIYKKNR